MHRLPCSRWMARAANEALEGDGGFLFAELLEVLGGARAHARDARVGLEHGPWLGRGARRGARRPGVRADRCVSVSILHLMVGREFAKYTARRSNTLSMIPSVDALHCHIFG